MPITGGLRFLAIAAVVLTVNIEDTRAATCNANAYVDLYFIIDSSSTVGRTNFNTLKQFVNKMIGAFPIGKSKVNVGVFRFNHKADLVIPLNKYFNKAQLQRAVSGIRYRRGGSSIFRALYYLGRKGFRSGAGDRKHVQNMAVLVTDSVSKKKYARYTPRYARLLKDKSGVEMFTVGVKIWTAKELQGIASQPLPQHMFFLKTFSDLRKHSAKIAKTFCWHINKHMPKKCIEWSPDEHVAKAPGSAYVKSIKNSFDCSEYCLYDPTCTAADWFADRKRCVKHRATGKALKTVHATSHHEEDHYIKQTKCPHHSRTTPMPTTPDPGKLCDANGRADVYILIDASGSVGRKNFVKELAFVDKIIDRLPIGKNKVRVGVYRFSHYNQMIFDMNKYDNAKALKAAIMKIRYTGGGTRTDKVLAAVRHRGFKASRGDRPSVHNVIVLVTDGVSNKRKLTLQEAEYTKRVGIEIFAVGVQIPTKVEVRKIASKPTKEHLAIIKLFHAMNQHAGGIANNLCHSVNNPPAPPTPDPAAILSPGKGCMTAYPMEHVAWPQSPISKKGFTTSVECRDYCMKLKVCTAVDWTVKTRICLVHKARQSWALGRMTSYTDKVVHYLKDLTKACFTTLAPTVPPTTTTTVLPTMDPFKQCSPEGMGDLFIVVDGSSSVTVQNFKHIKTFVSMVVDNLPIAPHQIRVGVVRFDSKSTMVFDLSMHIDKAGVKGDVKKIKYTGGPSFAHLALKELNTVGFTMMYGARATTPKYVLFITDGTSSKPTKTLQEATVLKTKYGAEIFAVGVALPNTKEVYDVASTPAKDHVTLIRQFDRMKLHAVDVATMICKGINNPKPMPTTTTTTTASKAESTRPNPDAVNPDAQNQQQFN
ncbi:collagen alpha-1(XII) chain-like [Lineus longissimus]|uniref:collagen alpha-1(XII) chain-like n=1 Tax=Lineus longissimus TaxID=88925 RepID=UPI002B4C4D03